MRFMMLALGVALAAAPLAAQTPDSAAIKLKQRVDAILGIPRKADEARRAGVPDSTVRTILDIIVRGDVPAEEAGTILTAETEAVREHGPTDNFGAFVQAQLASGKRGRDLAAAIRAEHQARGRGKPQGGARTERRDDDDDDDRAGRPDRDDDSRGKARKSTDSTTKGKRPENPGAKGKRPF